MSDTTLLGNLAIRSAFGRVVSVARRIRRVVHDSGVRTREYRPFPNVPRRKGRQETVEIPMMERLLDLPRGVRVLEIGCGGGIGLAELARRLEPTRLVGLDVDAHLLEEAHRYLGALSVRAELVHGDARQLPFPTSAFDVVIDFGTCYHIAFPAQALREVHRVLADGGLFVHETRLAQLLSHPIRSFGRAMPHHVVPALATTRWAGLWCVRQRRGDPEGYPIGPAT